MLSRRCVGDSAGGLRGLARTDVIVIRRDCQMPPGVGFGTQLGDLAIQLGKAVTAQLGSDCLAELDRKITQLRTEADAWRHLAISTDHDDVRAGQPAQAAG